MSWEISSPTSLPRYPFNVIQPSTGAKVDLVPLSREPGTRTAFARKQRIVYDDVTGRAAWFASCEDMIVAKLCAYRETDSEKHLRDARGILVTRWGQMDMAYIARWVQAVGVNEIWQALVEAVQSDEPTSGNESGGTK